jgi:hypothetical protein
MKPDVLTGQGRLLAFNRTAWHAQIHKRPFTDKIVSGKDDGTAKRKA